MLLLLGAVIAVLGVAAVAGIERIDLPPEQVRAIAAALPAATLVLGVVLLILGALLGRVATHEAPGGPGTAARTPVDPALRGAAPPRVPAMRAEEAEPVRPTPRERAT